MAPLIYRLKLAGTLRIAPGQPMAEIFLGP